MISSQSKRLLKPVNRLQALSRSFTAANPFATAAAASKMEASENPLTGLWKPNQLQALYYGPNAVELHLIESLPTPKSKAFIITGRSLATQTPLIDLVASSLGPTNHAGTFSDIGQHAPIAQLDEATEKVFQAGPEVDTLVSVGGGSPIDSAKVISSRMKDRHGRYLHHVTIPTTLSAAECTFIAGYTDKSGSKTGIIDPKVAPHVVIYDPTFGRETPPWLFLSTGLRALDHAVESMYVIYPSFSPFACLPSALVAFRIFVDTRRKASKPLQANPRLRYHPTASEMPCKTMAISAFASLAKNLPKYHADPKNEDTITRLLLAAYASLGYFGQNMKGGLGLSHSLGYALGAPYGIPHGITSCLTLGHVVKLKAESSEEDARQLARLLPFIGGTPSGDAKKDAVQVGDGILKLVDGLGLKKDLKKDYGVEEDQVPVITRTATKAESGPVYERVEKLVKGLY